MTSDGRVGDKDLIGQILVVLFHLGAQQQAGFVLLQCPFVGNFLGPRLGLYFEAGTFVDAEGKTQPIIDFSKLFLVPAGIALIAAILLLLFFHPPVRKNAAAD